MESRTAHIDLGTVPRPIRSQLVVTRTPSIRMKAISALVRSRTAGSVLAVRTSKMRKLLKAASNSVMAKAVRHLSKTIKTEEEYACGVIGQ